MDGGGVCVGRGDLLSSPQALGQLLRKESRPRRAMKPKKAEPHSFREKVFRKKPPVCAVCKVTIDGTGVSCRVCKVATHRKCEAKVTSACQALPPAELRRNTAPVRRIEHLGSTKSLNHSKQRSTLPRSFSLDPLMERRWDLDLTYVTERILAAAFPARPDEQRHRGHLRELAHVLQSKHRDKYLLFNLSEKRHDLTRLNPKVQDFGWPELHAPPLDKLCSICKAMETWLSADPQHVVVLYCKGSKGKLGVIVSAYMHYSKISAGADQALATLTMRKFCEDKVATELQPSQRRYISYFSGLLSGSIRMNSSPLFLHYVLIPTLPAFEPGTGFQPFLKIYQSMQLVYTSGVYHIAGPGPQQLCISLEPALLLKGDVMVTCYHKGGRGTDRTLVFRVQFHTCTIHGPQLTFPKDQLDEAWTDERFPFQASVEFVFSSSPEKIKGSTPRNDPSVSVDYNTAEPAVRWDSYENFNQHHEDSVDGSLTHTRGPLDGSPYAQVQRPPRQTPPAPSPEPPPPPMLSVSSDSGHSSTLTTEPAAESPGRPPPTAAERQELDRLLGGCGVASGGRGAGRETAILDDEEQPTVGGGPHLGVYPGHRPGLSRHCSCRQGYRESCGVPNGGYYRPEGTLERRRLAYGGYEGSPQGYAEASMEKRRLCRSLSEGPYPCPPEMGKPATGDFGYRAPGYREVVILEDPGLPALYPCPACEEKLALPTAALYGLRLEREAGEGWATEAGKPLLHSVRPGHPLPLLLPACGHHHAPMPDYSCLKSPKAGEEGHEGCSYTMCPEGRYGHPGYPALVTYSYGGAVPSYCPAYGRVPHSCGSPGEGRGYPSPGVHSPRAGSISPGSPPYPQSRKLSYEIPTEEGGNRYPLPGHLASAGPLASAESLEPVSWREGPSGHSTLPRSPRDAPGSASSELSGPSTPLHTSSPVQGKESTRRQDTRSPTSAPTQRLSPGEALPPVSQAGTGKAPELPSGSGPEPPAPSPVSPTFPPSSPSDWPQERSPGGLSDGASPRSPVPTTLPGLRHAPWQGPRGPPDSPDGSPLTPVPSQMPWLVASPEPPQSSPTPAFPLAASYDTNGLTQPPLPEKRHLPGPGQQPGPWGPERASSPARGISHHVTFAPLLSDNVPQPPEPPTQESQSNVKFVQDTSKFWYKPHLSRDQAIALLKDKDPGAFLIRDSHSFQGAYGLALKVATPPPSAQPWKGDPLEQLVRHFLIETGPKGVKIKGCPSEPYFGSLSALVSQHSISPISLPCCLHIPSKDPLEETPEAPVPTNMSTAADLLRQGAACSVLYLTSVETESLTGPQAVARASSAALSCSPRPTPAVVHFKVSAQGITLTDNQRKLFFRRHYPVNSITFSSTDPQDRRWTNPDGTTSKIFGFVAKKPGSPWENVCHLFAELDPDQPAGAIVTFITKVLLGQRK
ncbi:PREDICTED: tensin-like C1 domain-containing phosphatase isoform X1 [Mandrillus leucophaeus]|uniref:Tensin 2 n=2 Tax=Mandrillus leucophaeus TaxID=9568 RepID=A0A2K5Z6C8_MANLE|nr:PREDICTED: tensin-like C1 domain-containing phosphatase isoform X1 [Mandrillus leucophaeus]